MADNRIGVARLDLPEHLPAEAKTAGAIKPHEPSHDAPQNDFDDDRQHGEKGEMNQCFLCHQTTAWNGIKGSASTSIIEDELNMKPNTMNVLAIDTGGTHVKILAAGQKTHREFPSGPTLTAKRMVSAVKKLAGDWKYDVVRLAIRALLFTDDPYRNRTIWGPAASDLIL